MLLARILGLSPLARGTLMRDNRLIHTLRFIPAGAGNTFPQKTKGRKGAVYPRWCGEHAQTTVSASMSSGLSPLVRGTPGPCGLRPVP